MIRVTGLSNTWGAFSLRNVSLHIPRGGYFVILGPCGSGKTLLLETIAGLHVPRRGRVEIDDRDVTREPPERRRVGLVYQQYALFPHLSIRENIAYGLRYRKVAGAARRRRVDEMLDLLDIHALAERRSPTGLSGGEAQKVALARALAIDPEVLLLDEPLGSLDYRARGQVIALLQRVHRETGVPIVHVTHDYTEAAALADELAVIHGGAIEQTGTVHELFWHPRNRFVAEFLGVENIVDGVCASSDADGSVVRALNGELVSTLSVPPGPVALCIRPEDVRLQAAGSVGGNIVAGRVREASEHGFTVRLRVEVAGADVAVVLPVADARVRQLGVGGEVALELPPERIHLMPKPEADADGP